jgi:arginine repressor
VALQVEEVIKDVVTDSGVHESNVYTQDDVVEVLQSEGFSISSRTLAYWRSMECIPIMSREGNLRYYTEDEVSKIRDFASSRDRGGRVLVTQITLEDTVFNIESIEVVRISDGTLRKILHTEGSGRLIMGCDESDISSLVDSKF